ncbi:MAG: hypothetical protein BCS36_11725 [Desulfovibrio sp. MES5]|uniref:peptidylprolyl isomerase n=1 Tax=Desulfovibrio sp. MES5 TaxID=1899016 RepID=UPI000B9CDBF9|nr:peptidylprolyl isomerase [Desulfovibrio sp. MES5]OXS30260.1 MAG: hypothetical protein BCS36_11725 [Desulfovibrio sp. MES5]
MPLIFSATSGQHDMLPFPVSGCAPADSRRPGYRAAPASAPGPKGVFWAARLALLACCLLLCACLEARLPEGVVATVNGEPIYLRTVQALLDSRSAALGTLQRPSLENMKRQYGDALGTLIIYALVRQDLRDLHIPVTDAALEAAVAAIRADYGGEEGLARFLADESLDENEWRVLMRDHLAMQSFEKRILLPGIRISLSDVRSYYKEHEAEFALPEILDVCLISAVESQLVDAFCSALTSGRPAEKEPSENLMVQCQEVSAAQLPPNWQKKADKLAPGQCAALVQEDGRWYGLALTERNAAHTMGMAEAYPLIENILQQQRKDAAFENWLTTALGRAQVRVNPDLMADLLTPPSARPSMRDDGTGDASGPTMRGGVNGSGDVGSAPADGDDGLNAPEGGGGTYGPQEKTGASGRPDRQGL